MTAALDKNIEAFVIYVLTLLVVLTPVIQFCPFQEAQIRLLLAHKTFIKISSKYLAYADIFLFDFIIELFENTSINKNAIKWIKGK